MSSRTTSHICSREREFLELKGDGSESVKVTIDFDKPHHQLNGWYLFLKEEGRNVFIKQPREPIPIVERFTCDTKYFQFDRNAGLMPDSFHYNYSPVSQATSPAEYTGLVNRLSESEMWRPLEAKTILNL